MLRYGSNQKTARAQCGLNLFEHFLPTVLRQPPEHWRSRSIHTHFESVWKLLCWSRFEERLLKAASDVGDLPEVDRVAIRDHLAPAYSLPLS